MASAPLSFDRTRVMEPLPIDPLLDDIVAAARRGAVVVEAPTGAGKTTRIAPRLVGRGQVLLVEPRRVAARAAARRIAFEQGWRLGERVGWHVRFDRNCRDDSELVSLTGGLLLQRLQADPFLDGVAAVVFDEVHERAMELDVGLALVAELRAARPELTVVAMSATLDGQALATWLGAERITSEGRSYPVEIRYRPRPDDRPIEERVAEGVRELLREVSGDILAFLPGVREIHRTSDFLTNLGVRVVPLYGDLPPERQDEALASGPERRVVLATNVAESSVTVPGVRAVVDSGVVRRPRFDPATGFDRLELGPISRASADQRAGRAGRVAPGVCLRLWTERAHRELAAYETPEIRRASLAGTVLQLRDAGIDPRTFRWFEAPLPEALDEADRLLGELGAVDGSGLTAVGRALVRLPVHPRLGRLLVEAARNGQAEIGALAAAFLSERDALGSWRSTASSGSDLLDRALALHGGAGHPAGRANVLRVSKQLAGLVSREVGAVARRDPEEALARAVLAAWPDRVALRREPGGARAQLVGGEGVALHPDSAVREPELFVAIDVGRREGADRIVRLASEVERAWLPLTSGEELWFDPVAEAVRARAVVRYRDLVLEQHPRATDPVGAAELLVAHARTALERVQPTEGPWLSARDRLRCLHDWLPADWPDVDADLLAELLPSVAVGCRSFAELRAADWVAALRDHLGWSRWSALDRLAPERLVVPSGRAIPVRYEPGGPPVLAVRIQELFGSTRTPTVADGAVRVRLELLAPNQRPQQITDDLAGFWARTWPEVRKELRGRYPKHAWPEDPVTAAPEARPKRRGESGG